MGITAFATAELALSVDATKAAWRESVDKWLGRLRNLRVPALF
jgi:hypothetical protein